ncbi:helix-turn-helix domain-containing protein [Chengkuizengella axinellae]|uniref:Helix-turn-helix transcriptional regulator n=1 Tax=Chengkuizengella axinellae TaxID=3064388 RepID=A0ABT9J0X0_9BACL|nr:helix-turn-helix transcriptional regulator [Chengkuizengella sp. 2205SS18-9]MDP5275269.1 helix-turn-helix transcriptional regulator [Chengkuizengella sp. 2205SS18-9]
MLGDRLVALRKKLNLTQKDVSEKLDISRSTYAQYEINRRVPEFATLNRLADFYDVSLDYLVGRTNPQLSEDKTTEIINEVIKEFNIELSNEEDEEKFREVIRLLWDSKKR